MFQENNKKSNRILRKQNIEVTLEVKKEKHILND
jgi:hypothetical protein